MNALLEWGAAAGKAFKNAFEVTFGLNDTTSAQTRQLTEEILARSAQVSWVFEAEKLQDRSLNAKILEKNLAYKIEDWESFVKFFDQRFSQIPRHQHDAGATSVLRVFSDIDDDHGSLLLEWNGPALRVHLEEQAITAADRHVALMLRRRNAHMHSLLDHLPFPTWLCDQRGELIWANKKFSDYGEAEQPSLMRSVTASKVDDARKLVAIGKKPQWFDVHGVSGGKYNARYALDVTELLLEQANESHAENALKLAFNDMYMGVAIFGANGKLSYRNKAFENLSRLQARFLNRSPDIQAFFDRLRDKGDLPEPQDYDSFREKIRNFNNAPEGSQIEEHWERIDDSSIKLTMRSLSQDVVVIFIEDISDVISKSRQFTTQLALTREAFNCLDMPLAVFTAWGETYMHNDAFEVFWAKHIDAELPTDIQSFLTLIVPQKSNQAMQNAGVKIKEECVFANEKWLVESINTPKGATLVRLIGPKENA